MTNRWKCTIFGYIHEGNEPPDVCHICGSDRSKFIAIDEKMAGMLVNSGSVKRH